MTLTCPPQLPLEAINLKKHMETMETVSLDDLDDNSGTAGSDEGRALQVLIKKTNRRERVPVGEFIGVKLRDGTQKCYLFLHEPMICLK